MPDIFFSFRRCLLMVFTSGQRSGYGSTQDTEDGRYSSLLLLNSVSCLYIIIHISTFVNDKPIHDEMSNAIIIIILTIAVVLMLFFLCRRVMWMNEEKLWYITDQVTFIHQQKLTLYGIYLLGIGVVIFSIVKFLAVVECLYYQSSIYLVRNLTTLTFDAGRIVFIGVQVVFFRVFKAVKFVSTCFFRYSLVLIIAANVACWFQITIVESMDRMNQMKGPENSTDSSKCNNSQNDSMSCKCYHKETGMLKTLEIAKYIFIPFVTEYSLIAAGSLFHLWGTLKMKPSIAENIPVRDSNRSYGSIQAQNQEPLRENDCPSSIVIASLVSLIYLTTSGLLFVGDFSAISQSLHCAVEIVYILHICVVGFVGLELCSSQRYMRVDSLTADEILLMISTVGLFLYTSCTFASSVGELWITTSDDNNSVKHLLCIINIGHSITETLNVWVQVTFIIAAHRRSQSHPRSANSYRLREIILYLAICNITWWISDSFVGTVVPGKESPTDASYFESWWTIFQTFMYPVLVFYRFHSLLMLCGLYIKFETVGLHTQSTGADFVECELGPPRPPRLESNKKEKRKKVKKKNIDRPKRLRGYFRASRKKKFRTPSLVLYDRSAQIRPLSDISGSAPDQWKTE
ncbi:proton channel OtopLc-like [Anneissia japonica]|uniref:proton channel OtopLc-like n=1 Tax=Anneissia japonica TaxID=1529436 RepID=UPI0014258B75|nr:proton channel OtopLc-like [Anneissia japonica]